MAKDILSEFGPESSPGSRASNGGQQEVKQIPYDPPKGPVGIMSPQSPGIHGENHGNNGTQGKH